MKPHPILSNLRERSRNSEAAQRTQAAIGVARRMAADGVALDDNAGHAALREVVGRGHAHDAATHDHHIAVDHSRFPLSFLRVAPILSERADQVNPATRVGSCCARIKPSIDDSTAPSRSRS